MYYLKYMVKDTNFYILNYMQNNMGEVKLENYLIGKYFIDRHTREEYKIIDIGTNGYGQTIMDIKSKDGFVSQKNFGNHLWDLESEVSKN